MAIIFTAPYEFNPYVESLPVSGDPVKVFLAGGITGCKNWQKTVIDILEKDLPDDVLIYNPRREEFDTESTVSARGQINWEFRHLEEMDIFTMFFAASNTSVGPICLYELGRYIPRMQMRFPTDWQNRIVIGIEDGYSRQLDDIETGDNKCVKIRPEMIIAFWPKKSKNIRSIVMIKFPNNEYKYWTVEDSIFELEKAIMEAENG